MIISVFDRVEIIVGKGENAGNPHFLLFPKYFEKVSFPDTSKGVIVWEWVNSAFFLHRMILTTYILVLDNPALQRCRTHYLKVPRSSLVGRIGIFMRVSLYQCYFITISSAIRTRCVCETLMPPKWPFFEKCNLDIRP